jgi:predicted porin
MKKSLISIAALSALAGGAQAQTSVTVYGILDVAYINQKSDGAGTSATTKANTSMIGASAESPSRLGFKGTEDLGGGNSAFFTVETGLQPTNATASAWNNRQSFVGLKKNGLGNFAVGTQYTPVFNALAASDVGQAGTMIGSAVYPSSIIGQGGNNTSASAPFETPGGPGNASNGMTIRTTNALTVQSDKFAGATLNAMYVQNGTTTTPITTSATTNNYSGWGVKLDYTWQKLYVVGAMQRLKSYNPNPTVVSVATSNPSPWNGPAGGNNTQDNQAYAAVTYDFGILKAYLQYVNRKDTSTVSSNYYAQRTAQQIGIRSFITPAIEGWANIGNGRITSYGAASPSANFIAWQAGVNYWLSKRTNLYGIYGANNLSSAAPVNPALNASAFAIGIKQTF